MVKRIGLNRERLEVDYATKSARDISKEMHVSVSTVRRRLKEYNITKPYAKSLYEAENLLELGEDNSGITNEEDNTDIIGDYEDSVKQDMIDKFEEWATQNLRGGLLATQALVDILNNNDLNKTDDDEYQLNTESYNDYRSKEPVVMLEYDHKQRKMEIYIRGKLYV